jgi:putative FmdB family regulatory protein
MPLYEYSCRSCSHRFEALVRTGSTPRCPSCEGDTLERLLSVFAVSTPGAQGTSREQPVAGCGTCGDPRGPGSCALS